MRSAYPGATIEENRAHGVWPVPSQSTDGYRSVTKAVQTAVPAEMLATNKRIRILDIGASFGDPLAGVTQKLHSQVEGCIETVALDVNPSAVHGIWRRQNADVAMQAMAQQLPLAAESVEIVIAKQLLAFLYPCDQSQSLREIERVLAPGGVAAIDLDPSGARSMDASSLWVLSAPTLRALRRATDEFTTYPFPSPSEVRPQDEPPADNFG